VKGGRWGAIESVVLQLLSLLSTAVLARLLVPDDFAIIAVVTVVLGLFQLATQTGLGAAIVQAETTSSGLESTMFWTSAIFALLAGASAWGFSGAVAIFFGRPDAAPYVAVASLGIVFGLLGSVPRSKLQREMRFRARAIIATLGTLADIVISLVLLIGLDFGVMSVIVGQVVGTAVRAVGPIIALRWVPSFEFGTEHIRSTLRFNLGYSAGVIVSYFVKNADYWAVGRFGLSLGPYYVAYVLPNIIRQRMTWVANSVLFPVFARLQGHRDRLSRGYTEVLRFVSLLTSPILLGVAVTSPIVVGLAFGSQWDAAVQPMAILAIAAAVDTLARPGSVVFNARGRPDLNVVKELLRLVVLAIGLLVAIGVGRLEAVAVAVLVSTTSATILDFILISRTLEVPILQLGKALVPALVPTGALLIVSGMVDSALESEGAGLAMRALVVPIVGAAVYVVSGFLLHRAVFASFFREVGAVVGLTGDRDVRV
jgi:PST family polysaccharide transporter